MKQYDYNAICKYYDVFELNEEENHKRNVFLEKVFKKYKIKTIFDLTCGTGAQAIHFLKKGYDVKASDFSKGMIEEANKKLKNLGSKERFLQKDMRKANFGKADAVITMYNAIGHLSKKEFEVALENFKDNLKPKGYYIFDLYNLTKMPEGLPLYKHIDNAVVKSDLFIIRYCVNKLNLSKGRIKTIHEWHIQKSYQPYKVIKNTWDLQLYTLKEMEEVLIKNGFKVLEVYGSSSFTEFNDKDSDSIFLIAQKE